MGRLRIWSAWTGVLCGVSLVTRWLRHEMSHFEDCGIYTMVECGVLLVTRRLQHEMSRVDGPWHLHIGVFNVFGFYIVVYLCISPLEVYSDVYLPSRYIVMRISPRGI